MVFLSAGPTQEDLERWQIGRRVCWLVHKLLSSTFTPGVLHICLMPLKHHPLTM